VVDVPESPIERRMILGQGQNHLAVAGGCAAFWIGAYGVPTRYREVVLTLSKLQYVLLRRNSLGHESFCLTRRTRLRHKEKDHAG